MILRMMAARRRVLREPASIIHESVTSSDEDALQAVSTAITDISAGIVWCTMINEGYIRFTQNFLIALEKNSIPMKLLIFCLDMKSYNTFIDGKNCVAIKYFQNNSNRLTIFRTNDYKQIVFRKLDVMRIMHSACNTFGYIDTDIYPISDPTPIFMDYMTRFPDVTVVSQCDEDTVTCSNPNHCPHLCSGIIVFRKSVPEIIFNYTQQDVQRYKGDQNYLLIAIDEIGMKRMTLPKDVLLNGSFSSIHKLIKCPMPSSAVAVHFNWLLGHQKEPAMKAQDMWLLQPPQMQPPRMQPIVEPHPTICVSWTQRLAPPYSHYTWGLGDALRGTLAVYQFCKANNCRFVVDIHRHPFSHFLEWTPSDLHVQVDRAAIHLYGLGGSPIHKPAPGRTEFVYGNSLCRETLTEDEKALVQNILRVKPEYKLELPAEYNVVHIRVGDSRMGEQSVHKLEHYIPVIERCTKAGDYLCCDSPALKRLCKQLLPHVNVVNEEGRPSHFGTDTSLDALRVTLDDMQIIMNARKIYTYTVYPWVSNFVQWISKSFDIPLESIQIASTQSTLRHSSLLLRMRGGRRVMRI